MELILVIILLILLILLFGVASDITRRLLRPGSRLQHRRDTRVCPDRRPNRLAAARPSWRLLVKSCAVAGAKGWSQACDVYASMRCCCNHPLP
jgi:hypothetical protein